MPEILTTTEAAQLLSCSARTVQRMIDAGELTLVRQLPGPNGAFIISRAEVERVLAERAAAA